MDVSYPISHIYGKLTLVWIPKPETIFHTTVDSEQVFRKLKDLLPGKHGSSRLNNVYNNHDLTALLKVCSVWWLVLRKTPRRNIEFLDTGAI